MRNEWKVYFLFSEKEQKGMLVLGSILLISALLSFLLPSNHNGELDREVNSSVVTYKLFEFDPNTIDSMKALQLGIPAKQVRTLLNYRRKGGRFYRKEQIANLYGLSPVLAEKLIPFVHINELDRSTNYKYNTNYKHNTNSWELDINEANQEEWARKTNLSKNVIERIIRYKNHLGNFEKVNQIKKVYGLNDTDFQLLRSHLVVNKNKPAKLIANTMDFENWQSLSMFTNKEIGLIMKTRKKNGGRIGWEEIVILCDLTENQAMELKNRILIND